MRIAAPCILLLALPAAADNPAEVMETETILVIGTTPLPGLGTPLAKVPANAQVFTGKDLSRQRPTTLPDFLERNATGVVLNASQGNPFQPDVAYRGFTASPLLGMPQGLSVFQDGVRINEPFGDVVNWDLVPLAAIASVQLVPGSNPAFGLNSLGGTINLYTKSGAQYPGGRLEAYGGSFRRMAADVEQGGSRGDWDYFFTGNALNDDGWAAHNPSRIRQAFAKVGYQTERSDLDVSVTGADNTLEGMQALPRSFLDDIRQPYTYPDRNVNRLAFVTAKGSRFLADALLLGGTAYARRYRNENVSSNVNDEFGQPLPGGAGVDENQATNDRSLVDQKSYGAGLQLTFTGKAWGRDNQLVVGASADLGNTRFTRYTQEALFTASRATVGTGDFEKVTDAASRTEHYGVYVSDSFSASEHWVLTLSGRYNLSRIEIDDRSGEDPLLDGNHRFTRFNPAVGINFIPSAGFTAYAGYSESMRAPTAMELTCADPGAPCKLPNSFLSDPPLKQVVGRTVEMGARGKWLETGTWSAAIYRTTADDDIQFVSSSEATTAGYFRNVGSTRRQGIELAALVPVGWASVTARYSLVDATFRSAFLESSPNNSTADAQGAIAVEPGARIPGIPRHSLKFRIELNPSPWWSFGAGVVAASPVHARGDENNRDADGRIPGYGVVNLDGRWRITQGLEVFARIDNLFDKRYASMGILGRNFFTGPGRTFDGAGAVPEQFQGPGIAFGAWVGLRATWK